MPSLTIFVPSLRFVNQLGRFLARRESAGAIKPNSNQGITVKPCLCPSVTISLSISRFCSPGVGSTALPMTLAATLLGYSVYPQFQTAG